MRRSQWFVLSGGFFIVFLYFYRFWSAVVPCNQYWLDKLLEPNNTYIYCIVKHTVYGSVFTIAFIFAILFLICGLIEHRAEKRKK
jgi:hypothetical protein